ncbi:MAG: hypothetical protein IJ521_05820, partial [Schwartzia sp.]|nr:hypothetical protein [Schwartzia sp. (in: firmicutes)]
GEDQIIKMDILGMIHSAENPFDIIYHVANYLEKKSKEAGYAQIVLENMRTVYGVVLGEQKLLTDELRDVEARLAHIEEVLKTAELTEEESIRADFAVTLHKKNIERLKTRIHELEANGESLYFVKK